MSCDMCPRTSAARARSLPFPAKVAESLLQSPSGSSRVAAALGRLTPPAVSPPGTLGFAYTGLDPGRTSTLRVCVCVCVCVYVFSLCVCCVCTFSDISLCVHLVTYVYS